VLFRAIACATFFLMSKTPQVKCPTCKKTGDWFAGKYGPFCSHRCKLVDLGKWFQEENVISEPLRPDHFKNYEDAEKFIGRENLDNPEAD
jgi:endogenous inhibitor of DNA gyrase (YacG/DUF329 family)